MRKLILLFFLLPFFAHAQTANSAAGNVAAASSSCLSTNCVQLRFYPNTVFATITVSGTFSATTQFEVSGDYGVTWVAAPGATTSTTSAGSTQFTVGGFTNMRARVSTYVSGTVSLTIIGSSTNAVTISSGGAGTPGGSTGNVQYNAAGAFGGFGTFTTGSPNTLALGTTQVSSTQIGTTTPAYTVSSTGAIGVAGGSQFIQFTGTDLLLQTFGGSNVRVNGGFNAITYVTNANCSVNSVSPAACTSAAAGSFVVPTTTTTYQINTTAVKAASRIFLFPHTDTRDLPGTPTCVAPAITSSWVVSATSTGASFTITIPNTTGQTCWDYWIIN